MLTQALKKLINGTDLTAEEAHHSMTEIMSGQAGEIRTAALLTALSCKGETSGEIESFARAMRKAAVTWPGGEFTELCDTCGTGGDASNTLNISTLSAILLAAMGIKVAKHGNRAVSSKSGSADLLEGMGVHLDLEHELVVQCLNQIGICFLFAQKWHPAMKFAGPVRKSMGVRTVFNILGPLTNPAPLTHQILGVFGESLMDPIAGALCGLGRRGAYVVHSSDGLDEVSISAPTQFIRIDEGKITKKGSVEPEDFGVKRGKLSELQIGSSDEALERSTAVLAGKGSLAEEAAVVINAALIYAVIKKSNNLKKAAADCRDMLRSGLCENLVTKWTGAF